MARRKTGNQTQPHFDRKRGDFGGGGYYGNRYGSVFMEGHDLTYTIRYATGDNGPEVVELHLKATNDRPITSDDLRAIPLRRLAAYVAQMDDANTQHVTTGKGPDEWIEPEVGRSRKRQITDEFLLEVTQRARIAFRRGERVRDVLAESFHTSPYTIDKWLAKARDAGHLQPRELSRKRK